MPILSPEQFDEAGVDGKDEGFADYLRSAQAAGMDINDWLEGEGWTVDPHQLERTTIRWMRPSSWVLELGPGSGRFSRQIVRYLTNGQLHLVDHSPWKVNFLRRYFEADPRIHVHLNDGTNLPPAMEAESMDLICAYSTFTYLRLGQIFHYAREFYRVLKPGGTCMFDYQDISSEAGWHWLEKYSDSVYAGCFSYFTPHMLERVFQAAGMDPVPDCPQFDDCNYLVFQKPFYHA